ncbi:hypothetical protein SOASR030_26960 [Leminorella grimontii]|uniref:Transmembrane protein n=1 Tax=Leminorella grimontii TaxID=82981 RepID=A0AAV5N6A6_9GAMM|nr:BPSS1780 family membrane protein [Leminorella grimontii]KFC94487.1 putative transmembrane protein [Leminorella grimontii ATCC 33999 = DSM 5078]GKX56584.1 hypothetical protein SOASR030_26960 [Leminorella grimontii]GKX59815.1 hypothetical protein SOASR031_21300 [Leminorella grimontii]VFS61690.1 Predicted integral membrane protein [Leminorella grimontii]
MTDQQEPRNPYTPPEASVSDVSVVLDEGNESFVPGGQAVPAGVGVNWISDAWNLIKPKLGMWILMGIILLGILMVIQFIPLVSLLSSVIMPIFVGGIITLCEKQRTTGEFDLGLMFSGFQNNLGSLIGVGAVMFGITILAVIVMFIVGGSAMLGLAMAGNGGDPSMALAGASGGMMFLSFILMFAIIMFGYALTWFAPALIVVHKLPLGQALSMSLSAVKKNLLPGLVYFIVISIIMIVASIPFFLGLLVAMPLMLATYHSSYRSLFIVKS